MRPLLIVLFGLIFNAANAEKIRIPWKGDYAHNSETVWSPENRYHKSGLTKNFMNGAPEEHSKVQRDSVLEAELLLPHVEQRVPFVILLHGCSGATDRVMQRWSHRVAKALNDQGYGVLILDR